MAIYTACELTALDIVSFCSGKVFWACLSSWKVVLVGHLWRATGVRTCRYRRNEELTEKWDWLREGGKPGAEEQELQPSAEEQAVGTVN